MHKCYTEYTLAALLIIVAGTVAGWYVIENYGGMDMRKSNTAASMDRYQSGPFVIGIRITPETPSVGKNRLTLLLEDRQGKPVSSAEIKAYGEMAAMGAMPAMRAPVDLEETAPGKYEGPFELQMRGAWPLMLVIEKPGMGATRLSFDMATGRTGLEIASGGTVIQSMQKNDQSATSGHSMPQQDANGIITSGDYRVLITTKPEIPQTGRNKLLLDVIDKDGNPVSDARVRAVIQRQISTAGQKQEKSEFAVEIIETTPASYTGEFQLPADGQWTLAVDIQKEKLGHGDLVFDLVTGKQGLQLVTTTPEGIAYYTCSMHSSVRAAGPGQCPICSMDLVPVTKEEVTTGTITLDNRRRQLIGLETGVAKIRRLASDIRAVGQVMYDETRLSDISLRFDAWVGDLKADFVGKEVRRGDMLFSVYGPELLAAQQEYLELLKRRRGQTDSFIRAAEKRLLLWDMSPSQIKQLQERGLPLDYVPIMSPRSGTVVEKNIVAGTAHKAGATLMRIADLSQVWIEADVYESELDLIKPGMAAEVILPYLPGRTYQGKVDYIYPYLTGATRTGRIRLTIENKDGALKPDMYAEVRLKTDLGERFSVPEEAVLFAGDSRVVFVDLGEGKLKPKTIKTGVRTKDYIEVLKGLEPGDRIVTSGNFLIAAESRLKSGIEQW